ncbi:MAG TPA: hypothetical protein PK605_06315 [Ignavibacteria bacterium]|nr:hypothetical protein [Bacteroidota bacterium]HRE10508.1 hypothetical protein [Ignavibacteria bacterium]HRF65169.1 hypothetical protein [Ignavibacteria bacterium]HRJ03999.1 hypothetical protein [Ignavibacteria bacterium]
MAFGFKDKRGLTKWRMPSASQAIIIILIFAVPPVAASFLFEHIPQFVRIPLAVIWFLVAFVVYIYIISHGRGKEKSTITSANALTGEFTIDNNWISFLAFYPLVASVGAVINAYYIIAVMLALTGFMIITIGRYFRKKIRIDNLGNLFILTKGEERFIDFNTVKSVEGKLNRMSAEAIYKPIIIIEFNSSITENKPVRLKFSVLRSVKYGTYSPSQLILSYIKEKCVSHGFIITYLNPEETDFRAEKF